MAGVLDGGDPYFRFNELRYSWVALSDWTYTLALPRQYWLDDRYDDDIIVAKVDTRFHLPLRPFLALSGTPLDVPRIALVFRT